MFALGIRFHKLHKGGLSHRLYQNHIHKAIIYLSLGGTTEAAAYILAIRKITEKCLSIRIQKISICVNLKMIPHGSM